MVAPRPGVRGAGGTGAAQSELMKPPPPAARAPLPVGRPVGLGVLLVALAVAAVVVPAPDAARIEAWTSSLGPLAPVTFALVFAAAVPTPLPKSVLTTATGLLFGIPVGTAVVVVGATVGAVASFLIARLLGRDAVARLTRGRLERVDALVERHGILAALAVRWVPVLPFTLLNYACGVTAMRLRHYALGTAIGVVPGSTLWVVVGSVGGHLSPWVPAGVSVGLAAVTLAAGAGVIRVRNRTSAERDPVSMNDTMESNEHVE